MSDRHKQLGVPATAGGVQFEHGGATLNIDASGNAGRVVVADAEGRRAVMVMPAAVLEGVLRSALDSMARATYEARTKRWDRGAA